MSEIGRLKATRAHPWRALEKTGSPGLIQGIDFAVLIALTLLIFITFVAIWLNRLPIVQTIAVMKGVTDAPPQADGQQN
jgi:hypothetical protein